MQYKRDLKYINIMNVACVESRDDINEREKDMLALFEVAR